MKIALLGYGKMGMAIEKIAIAKNHEIIYKVTLENAFDFMPVSLKNVDVAIDFSMPTAAYDNILKCFEAGVPVVVGTTGWYDQLDEIKKIAIDQNQALVYSSNFSIGVNLFFKLNQVLASMMKNFSEYDVMIEEIHHTAKKRPSKWNSIEFGKTYTRKLPSKINYQRPFNLR